MKTETGEPLRANVNHENGDGSTSAGVLDGSGD